MVNGKFYLHAGETPALPNMLTHADKARHVPTSFDLD